MAFRVGLSTKLDDRVYAMEQCKNLPLCYLMLMLYPNMYPLHSVDEKVGVFWFSLCFYKETWISLAVSLGCWLSVFLV